MITLDNKTSAAIEEGARLFLLNQSSNYVEAAFRMRALQEISQNVTTECLMLLVQVCAEAKRAGTLRETLETYIGGGAEAAGKAGDSTKAAKSGRP